MDEQQSVSRQSGLVSESRKMIELIKSLSDSSAFPPMCLAAHIHLSELESRIHDLADFATRSDDLSVSERSVLRYELSSNCSTMARIRENFSKFLYERGLLTFVLMARQEIDNATSNE